MLDTPYHRILFLIKSVNKCSITLPYITQPVVMDTVYMDSNFCDRNSYYCRFFLHDVFFDT